MTRTHVVYHIPVCPFSQRLEILLTLRGQTQAVEFHVVDITKPRAPELLEKTRGTTALPVLETADGRILKESLVILRYLDESVPGPTLRRRDPVEHAIESMLIGREGPFTTAGYLFVMNQELKRRSEYEEKLLSVYRDIDAFLVEHGAGDGPYLFDDFGLAETVFTPMFQRFWFLEYFEGFQIPTDPAYQRVRRWQTACMSHQAAQQVNREQIVKLYYDYALGAGNGALVEGRSVSSFSFMPDWRARPWPPRDKYSGTGTDADLGLLA